MRVLSQAVKLAYVVLQAFADITCTPELQIVGLVIFYYLTNGPSWEHKWPLPETPEFTDLNAFIESLGYCNSTIGGLSATVPAWCCWYGISCCLSPDPCPSGTLDRSICLDCNIGRVTRIDLFSNKVSVEVEFY